jgi:hypothetical protein
MGEGDLVHRPVAVSPASNCAKPPNAPPRPPKIQQCVRAVDADRWGKSHHRRLSLSTETTLYLSPSASAKGSCNWWLLVGQMSRRQKRKVLLIGRSALSYLACGRVSLAQVSRKRLSISNAWLISTPRRHKCNRPRLSTAILNSWSRQIYAHTSLGSDTYSHTV